MIGHADHVGIGQAQNGGDVASARYIGIDGQIAGHSKGAVHHSTASALQLRAQLADREHEAALRLALRCREDACFNQNGAGGDYRVTGKGQGHSARIEQMHLPALAVRFALQKHRVRVAEFARDAPHLGLHQAFCPGEDEDGSALVGRIAEGVDTVKFEAHRSDSFGDTTYRMQIRSTGQQDPCRAVFSRCSLSFPA